MYLKAPFIFAITTNMSHRSLHHYTQRGQILLLAVVFFGIFFTITATLAGAVVVFVESERYTIAKSQALSLAEAGIDKAIYELNQNPSYTGETNTALGDGTFTIAIATIDTNTRLITAVASVPNKITTTQKTVKAKVGLDSEVISFYYGIQAGNGGITLANSSSVNGNIFSSGSVIGSGGNYVRGSVISSGPSGLVYGIHATSSVYAHTIGGNKSTIIDKDAYYATSLTNTTVTGASYPNSPDQSPVPLPISDEQIEEWKDVAEAGGTAVCSSGKYEITSGVVTLGPVKIPCDFTVSNSAQVTIEGNIWVEGDIVIQNSAIIRMDSDLGAQNVAIIADNPADQLNSGTIEVKNSAAFYNSGTDGSFIFLISQNKSAENGGSVNAFSLSNSASAIVAYAAHGLIPLANSVSLKEVTAYKITLQNSAMVTYDTGLGSSVFDAGPGGGWTFIPGTYSIVQY